MTAGKVTTVDYGTIADQLRPAARRRGDITGVQDAVVHTVTADGVWFTLPSFDDGLHRYGPAPYPLMRDADGITVDPPAGTACLAVFVDADADLPRVLTFLGWAP